ncbi:hypothetical protein CBR_g30311 [Chara braunii]|uniref:Uncharacterized protein n=1 Tax=Chara braunii TaxID=69332 RepID=A0A388JX60_CHABU|nr:hypothetical protein CBR_g30311 [Chara braunii]|eukprot:GBG62357.1 hypothetical protein CBR_g30311 [Chara braunii]
MGVRGDVREQHVQLRHWQSFWFGGSAGRNCSVADGVPGEVMVVSAIASRVEGMASWIDIQKARDEEARIKVKEEEELANKRLAEEAKAKKEERKKEADEARKREELEEKHVEAKLAQQCHADYMKALQDSFASYTAEMAKVWGGSANAKVSKDSKEIQLLKAQLESMKTGPTTSTAGDEVRSQIEMLTRKINDLTAELAKVTGEKKRSNGVVIMSSLPIESAKGKQKIVDGASINEDRWEREIETMRKRLQAKEEREREK